MDDETIEVVEEGKDDVNKEVETTEESKTGELKYTDDDINKIVDAKFAKWQEKKDKELTEAKKLAEMSVQEKLEFELKNKQAEFDALQAKVDRNELIGVARTMLSEQKLTIDEGLLELLVVSDAEKTKGNVDSFVKLFNEAVNKGVLDRVKNPNEKRGSVSKVSAKDKREIYSIKDPILRQQKLNEIKDLY